MKNTTDYVSPDFDLIIGLVFAIIVNVVTVTITNGNVDTYQAVINTVLIWFTSFITVRMLRSGNS